jgi:hypothetical protein
MRLFICAHCDTEFKSYKTRKFCSLKCVGFSRKDKPRAVTDAMRASWSITAQKNKGIKKRVTSAVVEGWKKISDKNKGRVMSDTWRENLSIGISATYKQRRMTRHQGKFKPSNPKKYKGDCTNIIYRSMWECNFMLKLDRDPKVVRWSSEEIIIQYRNPITGRISRYFPDFYVERLTEDGSVNKFLVEIKPKYQRKQKKNESLATNGIGICKKSSEVGSSQKVLL